MKNKLILGLVFMFMLVLGTNFVLGALEDFTTYTEVDGGSDITINSSQVTYSTMAQNIDDYVYKDFGVNYFNGDFTHIFTFNISSGTAYFPSIWGLSNTLNDIYGTAWTSGQPIVYLRQSSVNNRIYLGVNQTTSIYCDVAIGTEYYAKVYRSETQGKIYAGIYSTKNLRDLGNGTNGNVCNLVSNMDDSLDFRYVMIAQSYNNADTRAQTGYIKDLDLSPFSNFTIITNRANYNISITRPSASYSYTSSANTYTTNISSTSPYLWNITLSAYGYLTHTYTNYNISLNGSLSATFLPAVLMTFTANSTLTNDSVTDFFIGERNTEYLATELTTTSATYTSKQNWTLTEFDENFDYVFVNNITNQLKGSSVSYVASAYYKFFYADSTNANSSVQTVTGTTYTTKTYTNPYPKKAITRVELFLKRSSGTAYVRYNNISFYDSWSSNETGKVWLYGTGNQEFTFIKNDWYYLTQTFNIVTGNNTYTFTDVYDSIITVNLRQLPANSSLNDFSGYIYNTSEGINESFSSLTSAATIYALQNYSYNVYVYKYNYSNTNTSNTWSITVDSSTETLYVYLYKLSSIFITFINEITNALMAGPTINLEVISDSYGYNTTTTTGYVNLYNLTPQEYILRYESTNYTPRVRYITVSGSDYYLLTLYLAANNTGEDYRDISMSVRDYSDNIIEGVDVKAIKYDIDSGNYIYVDQCRTNFLGTCSLFLLYNSEFYKFQIEYENETKLTTTPSYITATSYIFRIQTQEPYTDYYFNYLSIDALLDFNNVTNKFRLTYNDNNDLASNFCVYVYSITSSKTLLNSSCLNTSSGTILVGITPVNGTYYVAEAYYNSPAEFLTSLGYEIPLIEEFGDFGLFLQILLSIVFALVALKFIEFIGVSISLSLILGKLIYLNTLPWTVLIGALIGSIVLISVLHREK